MRPGMHTGACLKEGDSLFPGMTPGCRLFPNSRDSGGPGRRGNEGGNGTFWLDKVRALRQLKPVGVCKVYSRRRRRGGGGGGGGQNVQVVVRRKVRTGRPCSARNDWAGGLCSALIKERRDGSVAVVRQGQGNGCANALFLGRPAGDGCWDERAAG